MTTPQQLHFDTLVQNSVVHINKSVGRPALAESKDEEVRARVEPTKAKEILAFCSGRRITRSDYLRSLLDLDTFYFDHIASLNDPEVKELIFAALKLAKKI